MTAVPNTVGDGAQDGVSGVVSDIQRFSAHDGPGIRTTVFLKGCPLRCPWCHNPESQRSSPEILFDEQKCIGCEACRAVCPGGAIDFADPSRIRRALCEGCGRCAEACPTLAATLCGRRMSVAEVMRAVERDRAFYVASGGGVTLSGGDPVCQPDFAADLLRACRGRGISTAIETAGWCPPDVLQRVIEHADLVLLDVKTVDANAHQRCLGQPLDPVVRSARLIAESGVRLIVRVPVVPGFNDGEGSLEPILAFAARLTKEVAFIPLHRLAEGKYRRLGRPYPSANTPRPTPAFMQHVAARATAWGLCVTE